MCYRNNITFFLKKSADTYPGEVTATCIVKIIDECPFDFIIETYPHHAESTGKRRVPLFDHFSPSPMGTTEVLHLVTNPQIESLRHIVISITRPQGQRNKKQPCSNPGELL